MQYRPDIQGLRAIAVLAVMVFHLNPAWLPGGFVGVDIFLVISGFLISSILLHKRTQPEYQLLPTLSHFYTSRIKRIVPAYFAMLVLVTLIAAILFLPNDFATYRAGLNKAAWFNSNNYFAAFGDYFAPANHEQPLLHTWSLAIEIQFYLIAPFVFLLLPRRLLNGLLPVSVLVLTAYAEYKLRIVGNEQASYYSLVARLPAFFLGAWVALLMGKVNSVQGGSYKLYLTWFAVGLITLTLFQPKLTGYFPGIAGLIPITGAALIILLNANSIITQLLSNRAMVWIGALSYSLYLWHWPVLAFMRYYTGAEILSWQYSIVFVLLTLTLAIISFYWIETLLRVRRSKRQIFGYFSLALMVLLTAGGMKRINAYYTPEPLPVEYTRYADPETICHGKIIGDCLKGDLSSDKEVLVLGDSHAAMLNHFFDYLGKEFGFKARVITASSCVTIPEFDYKRIAEWAQKSCLSQIEEAQRYLKEVDIVFLAAFWTWQLESNEFKGILNEFVKSGKEIYILSQEPLLKNNPLRNKRFSDFGFDINTIIDIEFYSANNYLSKLDSINKNVTFIDLSRLQLFENVPFYKEELIYYDEHHLNELGVKVYAKQFREASNKINPSVKYDKGILIE